MLGVSRRGRLAAAFTGPGIGATVIRESGDIDVHIVTHNSAGGRLVLPRIGGALTWRRRAAGLAVALVGGPLLTMLLLSLDGEDSITAEALSYQLLVVIVALVGGLWPALFAAVLAGLTLDYFFVEPVRTITVEQPSHAIALLLFVVIAALVSYVVDLAARRTRVAQRAAAESELLATVSGSVLRGEDALQALVSRTREAFSLEAVRLTDGEKLLAADGAFAGAPSRSSTRGAAPSSSSMAGCSRVLSGGCLASSRRKWRRRSSTPRSRRRLSRLPRSPRRIGCAPRSCPP